MHAPTVWLGFTALVAALLVLDLGVLNRQSHVLSFREAAGWSAGLIALALLFGAFLWMEEGTKPALEYLTGYVIELSLSADNLFVFLLIFQYFAVPAALQPRILKWGILGALALRGLMIGLGALLLAEFTWIIYLFGVVLILTGIRMYRGIEDRIEPERNPLVRVARRVVPMVEGYDGQRFLSRTTRGWMATPLLLVLLMVEWSDLVFAIDSIPAIFAVTRDPFIVYSSNVIGGARPAGALLCPGRNDGSLRVPQARGRPYPGLRRSEDAPQRRDPRLDQPLPLGDRPGSRRLRGGLDAQDSRIGGGLLMRRLFADTTVLITGASGGLGAAFADLLAPTGARLFLTARRPEALDAVAASARAAGADVETLRLDLTAPGGIASLVGELEARGLAIDHLINNAGIGLVGRGDATAVEEQLRVVDLNVRATTELALRVLPGMVARGRGGVLNVASIGAFQGLPWLSTYGGSKAYVLGWSEALHVEMRGTGVRCCCLCPGPVDTGWFDAAHLDSPPLHAVMQGAEAVARAGLRGYARNRSHVMSGTIARASAWLTRAVPRAVAARAATSFGKPRRPR